MNARSPDNRRILVVDDNPSIHDDFKAVLGDSASSAQSARVGETADALFGATSQAATPMRFRIDSAHQGEEARTKAAAAVREGRPYAVAFVDMRMPPGWNGIETIRQLWQVDPRIQVVICTAYSDDPWDRIVHQLGRTDRLLILKKPFDGDEARQLALTLTTKWNLARDAETRVADLEAAVHQRTSELRVAKEAAEAAQSLAEAANRAKSQFLGTMSHELRTPLNGITGMIDLLRSTPIGPTQRDYLDKARTCADVLLAAIGDILDYSSIDTGQVELASVTFDFRVLVKEVTDSYVSAAAQKGLQLGCVVEPDVIAQVVGDPDRLRQVLSKLLSNAVKFTQRGMILVRVARQPTDEPNVSALVRVTDTGIGIAADKIPVLFKPFAQADSSTTRRYGGTGLGLAICNRVVELMGGRIGVETAVGQGSTFWFTIPLARDQHQESSVKSAAPVTKQLIDELPGVPVPAGSRILVVEDTDVIQFFICEILARQHYECEVAANGRLALEAIGRRQYHLILMDCHMPEMDGFEATRRIRAMEAAAGDGRHIPIIAMTADVIGDDRQKYEAAGMDDYVSKPVDTSDLLKKIRRLILKPGATPRKGTTLLELLQATGDEAAAPPVGQREMPRTPAIDVDSLLARCLGDVEFAKSTLEMFGKRTAADMDAVRNAVVAARPQETAELAHGLEGIANHVGARQLGMIAARIEKLGHAAQAQPLEQCLRDLTAEIDRCVAFIPTALGELDARRRQDPGSK